MLLTLSAPTKSEFEFKSPHDFPATFSSAPKRLSPPSFAHPPTSHPPPPDSARTNMSTPHRGLPPPAAMTLPDPQQRGPPPPSLTPSLGQMPAPPSQWQGAEDSMRNWLAAKAEEDKRKQEEERTRQESLRLEQRKIESTMLRESMAGGVPPHMVPIIFAGIGGASLGNTSADWLQQYAAQLQAQQQQHAIAPAPHQVSPDVRRDSRGLLQGSYVPAQPPPPTSVLQGQPAPSYTYSPTAGNISPSQRNRQLQSQGPTSAPRSALPRLTTNEMHIAQAPGLQSGSQQQDATSSPSIYFHHWVPPSSQGASGSGSSKDQPATPTDYTSSPKKRKDTRAHQPTAPPTSAPQSHASPAFTHVSSTTSTPPAGSAGRGRHARNRSDFSTRMSGGRPSSRHPTPPLSGRSEGFDTTRARTASESAGSRGSNREERIRPSAGSVPGSPGAKYERH